MRAVAGAADSNLSQEIGGEGAARQVWRDVLLVESVAGFVQGGEKRHRQIVDIVTRGDAHVVAREGHFKRMRRDIEPATPEVEADQRREFEAERGLRLDVIVLPPKVDRQRRVVGDDFFQKWQDAGFKFAEKQLQLCSRHAGFKLKNQGVEGMLVVADGLRQLDVEGQHLL